MLYLDATGAQRRLLGIFLSAGLLGVALMALRYGVIENGLLPRDCGDGGSDPAIICGLTWFLVLSFRGQSLGLFALALGFAGFFANLRICGWIAWLVGIAGLVLYCPDYAAVGAMLGLLTLLRPGCLNNKSGL